MPDFLPAPDSFSVQIETALARLGRLVRAAGARHGIGDDEAGALLQDVRINVRDKEQASTPGQDRIEEEIELIARDLDQLLAEQANDLDAMLFDLEAR